LCVNPLHTATQYALLFVVFDVEAAFLYPWALAYKTVGMRLYAWTEMVIFVGLLMAGWAWAWRRRAIDWE
jgi:NADH-quinone oxidoreductase subunit A